MSFLVQTASDFSWQQHREMQKIEKVPGVFTVSPFSVVTAANIKGLKMFTHPLAPYNVATGQVAALNDTVFTDKITIECRMRRDEGGHDFVLMLAAVTDLGLPSNKYRIYFYYDQLQDALRFQLWDAAHVNAVADHICSCKPPLIEWSTIAVVWDGSLGGNSYINIYIDGAFQETFESATLSYTFVGATASFVIASIYGSVDFVRVWNDVRALILPTVPPTVIPYLPLAFTYQSAVDNSDSQWANLKLYYKFNEGAGAVVNDFSANNVDGALVEALTNYEWFDGPEVYSYLASYPVAIATLTAEANYSLRYPWPKPRHVTPSFCPVIRYTDDDGVQHAYKLWSNVGESIANVDPYAGQTINKSATLELWSVYGTSPATLAVAQNLVTSLLYMTYSATAKDRYTEVIDVPTFNTNIFAEFPWVFPVGFTDPLSFDDV